MVPCHCCGHRTMAGEGDSFCPVCAWDDRDIEGGWQGKPRRGLVAGQRTFQRTGVHDEALRDLVRPARPEEAPPAWWYPFDAERDVVRALIEDAFRDARLDGGTTLDEAELIDDYASPARTENDRPPRGYVEPGPWQELTPAGLDRFPWGNFPFHDARGIRYYFPAFACDYFARSGPIESLVYALEYGHQLAAIDRLLDRAQHHAVARFLAHLATANSYISKNAAAALRNLWGAHLDPEHLAHALR